MSPPPRWLYEAKLKNFSKIQWILKTFLFSWFCYCLSCTCNWRSDTVCLCCASTRSRHVHKFFRVLFAPSIWRTVMRFRFNKFPCRRCSVSIVVDSLDIFGRHCMFQCVVVEALPLCESTLWLFSISFHTSEELLCNLNQKSSLTLYHMSLSNAYKSSDLCRSVHRKNCFCLASCKKCSAQYRSAIRDQTSVEPKN